MASTEWKKQGLIYCPQGDGFFKTHTSNPIVTKTVEGNLRLFYSSRDHDDRYLPTFVEVDGDNPTKIIHINDTPLSALGSPGKFDDSGIAIASCVERNNVTHFYYTGWKRRRVVSFELSVGVLLWNPATQLLERMFEGPLIGQDRNHPLLSATPFVVFEQGTYRMWYCSGTDWKFPDGNPEPIYTVFYAESNDGLTWTPHGKPVIPYGFDGEVISAPWVVKTPSGYSMWYSTRGCADRTAKNYRIGYAESVDGISWKRLDDQAGITVSRDGWDSEMVCYPAVVNHQDKTYMFYSGNAVGRGGLGYALADKMLEILEW